MSIMPSRSEAGPLNTVLLGALGFAIAGPLGAVALGAIGAASDADAIEKDVERRNKQQKESDEAFHRQFAQEEPSPTRATASQWVDPVDPAFLD